MKRKCLNCSEIFSLCDCNHPNWDMGWSRFQVFRDKEVVTWNPESKTLSGDGGLLVDFLDQLDGRRELIAVPGCTIELIESNPYAIGYLVDTELIPNTKLSSNAPDYWDLIPNFPDRIY